MSKIFDVISSRGHSIARKRAEKADPQYANRETIRRDSKPGVILVSEGPGGIDGWANDLKYIYQFRPWWLKVSLHIHWWMEKHGPRATYRALVAYHQRGKRGWADSDTWNLDSYLAKVIAGSVRHLNENKHGWPGPPMTFEDWGRVLDEIADGMEYANDENYGVPTAEQQVKFDLAMDHLKERWFHLWN